MASEQPSDIDKPLKPKKPRKPNISSAVSPEVKAARAHKFILDHINNGHTITDLARIYDCSPRTAYSYVEYARTHGLYLDRARELIQQNLLPRALGVYQKYLDGDISLRPDDLAAARDILFGLGVLSKTSVVSHESGHDDSLEGLRKRLMDARQQSVVVTVEKPSALLPSPDPSPAPVVVPQGNLASPRGRLSDDEQVQLSEQRSADLRDQGDEDA